MNYGCCLRFYTTNMIMIDDAYSFSTPRMLRQHQGKRQGIQITSPTPLQRAALKCSPGCRHEQFAQRIRAQSQTLEAQFLGQMCRYGGLCCEMLREVLCGYGYSLDMFGYCSLMPLISPNHEACPIWIHFSTLGWWEKLTRSSYTVEC